MTEYHHSTSGQWTFRRLDEQIPDGIDWEARVTPSGDVNSMLVLYCDVIPCTGWHRTTTIRRDCVAVDEVAGQLVAHFENEHMNQEHNHGS